MCRQGWVPIRLFPFCLLFEVSDTKTCAVELTIGVNSRYPSVSFRLLNEISLCCSRVCRRTNNKVECFKAVSYTHLTLPTTILV